MKVGVGFAASPSAPNIVDAAQSAERLGFDAFWLTDSHLIGREALTMLGALAVSTERILIGPGVSHLAGRHPSILASAMATLSELAPGRVRLGIGVGDSGANNMGVRRASLKELETAVLMIRGLLRGDSVDGLRLGYAPKEVPIIVAAAGPRMQELAGRVADGALLSVSPAELPKAIARVRSRGPAAHIVLWTTVAVDDDHALARAAVRGAVARRAMNALSNRQNVEAEDRMALERLRAVYNTQTHGTTAAYDLAEIVPETWIDRFAIAGTPDQVRQRIQHAAKDGADEFSMILLGTRIGERGSPELLTRFAETVLTPLRAAKAVV